MPQIRRLILREGPPILYASTAFDEMTLEMHYSKYCGECESFGIVASVEGFQGWLAMNSALKYAGTGEHQFLSHIDEFQIPESGR